MEFDIDIHTGQNGEITIEDFSKDYNQYFPEDQVVQEYGRYKYSECKTLNVIMKITTNKVTLTDVLLHEHDQLVEDPTSPGKYLYDIEKQDFKVSQDGYYVVNHVVLPTKEWYQNTYLGQSDDYRNGFTGIYIIDVDNKLYKLIDGKFQECTVKEIIERNHEGTTIQKCLIDIFYTGSLQLCYINYCKKLFSVLTRGCKLSCASEDSSNLTYIRDFLWMVLNIIDYQISFKQYMEAQRLLEMINYCGSFCQKQELNAGPNIGCGCSQN